MLIPNSDPGPTIEPDMTNEEYHAHPNVGRSMADQHRQSRAEYHSIHVTKELPRKEPTKAMKLGSLFHTIYLEPERAEREQLAALSLPGFCIAPAEINRRTKIGREQYAAFLESRPGEECVSNEVAEGKRDKVREFYAQGRHMALAVEKSEIAQRVLRGENKRTEVSYFWTDEQSGLPCKCRIDHDADNRPLLDFKSTFDPAPDTFSTQAARLGYHRQNEWYWRGYLACTGENKQFGFIVVRDSMPWECAVYELDEEAVELGRNQNRTIMNDLASSYRNDVWTNAWERKITKLSLPKFAVHSDDYEVIV